MYQESYALDRYAHNDAWPPVLEAIEQAMDVPGLPPQDRAALAELYELAQPYAGHHVIRPADAAPAAPDLALELLGAEQRAERAYRAADEPGGLIEVRERLAPAHQGAVRHLVRAGYITVDDVRAATDAELLKVNRVGPVIVRALREAIEAAEVAR